MKIFSREEIIKYQKKHTIMNIKRESTITHRIGKADPHLGTKRGCKDMDFIDMNRMWWYYSFNFSPSKFIYYESIKKF